MASPIDGMYILWSTCTWENKVKVCINFKDFKSLSQPKTWNFTHCLLPYYADKILGEVCEATKHF